MSQASPPALFLAGKGAVSAAGWGVPALLEAALSPSPLPVTETQRPDARLPSRTRPVPSPESLPAFLRHPRLRRCSSITRFAAAAALEALGESRQEAVREGTYRLGILFVFMNGCVNYSNRFYGEVLSNPSLASPILFPETVFNAPASHLAALLNSTGPAYTLVGDSAQFLGGVDLGIQWLLEDRADGVLVLGAEELDWLSAEAALLFRRQAIVSEGAGALLLEKDLPSASRSEPRIQCLTPSFTYAGQQSRARAWEKVRSTLPPATPHTLRIVHGPSADEPGDVLHLQNTLGHALGAALALECVLAAALLDEPSTSPATPRPPRVDVLHAGTNQQAVGATFLAGTPTSP